MRSACVLQSSAVNNYGVQGLQYHIYVAKPNYHMMYTTLQNIPSERKGLHSHQLSTNRQWLPTNDSNETRTWLLKFGRGQTRRLDSLNLIEAKQEYLDLAGIDAALELATRHTTYSKGKGTTIRHFNTATMEFLEQSGLMREQETTRFDLNCGNVNFHWPVSLSSNWQNPHCSCLTSKKCHANSFVIVTNSRHSLNTLKKKVLKEKMLVII